MRRDRGNSPPGNADLLSGITVNTDAMARVLQLAQEGFIVITEWD